MSQNSQSRARRRDPRNCDCHNWTLLNFQHRSGRRRGRRSNCPRYNADASLIFKQSFTQHCATGTWTEKETTLKRLHAEKTYSQLVEDVFVSNGLLASIQTAINAHAERKGKAFRLKEGVAGQWQIRLYFMILIAMALYNCKVREFWSMDETKGYRRIAKYMNHDDWTAINRHFVLNIPEDPDYQDLPRDDPDYHPFAEWSDGLCKMRDNLREMIDVGNVKTTDESRVVGKSGRSPFTNRIADKPIRNGQDVFTTATYGRVRVGIVNDLIPYCGNWTYLYNDDEDVDPQTELDMDTLVQRIISRNCVPGDLFCCDGRFTSVFVFEKAAAAGIGAFGVIHRTRRCLPKGTWTGADFKAFEAAKQRGSFRQYESSSGLHVTVWWDSGKKPLFLLDNCLDPRMRMPVKRRHNQHSDSAESGTVEHFQLPVVCYLYNKYMGAVDAANRSRSMLFIDRQTVRKHLRVHLACVEFLAFVSTADLYADSHNV